MTTINPVRAVGKIVVLGIFFLTCAWSKDVPLQIKVVSALSRQFQAPPLDPPDCNWRDISAYCYSSSSVTYIENKMVVQESDGQSLEIACTVYARWSPCATLPVNHSFQAWRVKRGLKIRYPDQRGKWRNQVYEILSNSRKQTGL